MKILKIDDKNLIKEAINTLSQGGLIIYPTETSYAVGVDATNEQAVTKLLNYKKRPEGRAISVAVANQALAESYVDINNQAMGFYKNFLPGPVTIISQSKHKTDSRLEAENGSLGIRIPNFKIMLDILSEFKKPISATLASVVGGKTPYSVSDILDNIPEKNKELIDLIIDAGQLPKNPPSTVIDTTTNDLTILRTGRIDPSQTKLLNTLQTESETQTIELGQILINENYSTLKPLLVLLNGELGVGKTHFTKGIAKELGIMNIIKSPTYNYVNEYKFATGKLFHMDAWKIQSKEDLDALGFYSWFKPGNVIVVEWPSVIMNLDQEFFDKLNYIYIDFIQQTSESRTLKFFSVN